MRLIILLIHRWAGLAISVFLIIVGLTGSLLAFNDDLEKLINPDVFTITSDQPLMSLASIANIVEKSHPEVRVGYFMRRDGQPTIVRVRPKINKLTGNPYQLNFDQIFIDPSNGKELGKRKWGDISQGKINLMPFIYKIHFSLLLGDWGILLLGVVALIWVFDSIYSIFLTFPKHINNFFTKWKKAWIIKIPFSSFFRFNFDLHRATGLWFLPLLLIFAWSSVMFNLPNVYDWTTRNIFDYDSYLDLANKKTFSPEYAPKLSWVEAENQSSELMKVIAKKYSFQVIKPIGLAYVAENNVYSYTVESNLDISLNSWDGAGIWIDGDTGKLRNIFLPKGQHDGNTISNWLRALHFGNINNSLAYRALVGLLGVLITLLSFSGIYIWYKKNKARKFSDT
jgi:uncharacterized iron-regulated membrane protein